MSNEENEHHGPDHRKPGKTEPEIRYVPLDIRMLEEEDDELDFVEVFRAFWELKTIMTVAILSIRPLFKAITPGFSQRFC